MTDERREQLRRVGLGPFSPLPCGCVFYGSERDEKDCREGHVHGRPLRVRQHPLVAEYLATVEAPSQATPDAEMEQVAAAVTNALPDMLAFGSEILPAGYTLRIDPLRICVSCAACDRPVLEQVAAVATSNTDAMEAVERTNKHREELMKLLHEVVTSAHAAEDAGDFVLWVQEKLASWR